MDDAADTDHLVRQAAREIGIDRDGLNPITVTVAGDSVEAEFRNRHGDRIKVIVFAGATFLDIHETLRRAWRDKKI